MQRPIRNHRRPGAILVLFLLCLVVLFSFLSLSIDLGMLASARTQCQDAADAAAMAGARALNGDIIGSANNNYSNVLPTAQAAASANAVLGSALQSSQVSVQIGRYSYVTANQRFEGQWPGPASENWSMVQASVTSSLANHLGFSKILNFAPANLTATATAAHRPRDVAIILDYSGSMRFASLVGDGPFDNPRSSNNGDSVIPAFGHYSSTNAAAMQATSFTSPYDSANITATTSDGRPPICADFYSDTSGTPAFTSKPASYATTPLGDNSLKTNKNTTAIYAQTLAQVLNIASPGNSTRDATFESNGYKAYGMAASFSRYTTGPGYYGKTFFAWPPDPSTGGDGVTNDWRKRYFYYYGTANACDDNSLLWDSSGNWQTPGSGNYSINYTAILNWIKNIGTNPFPTSMRSGRIVYYTTIPSSINTASWPPANLDERFWKDYIDYCLGVCQTGSNSWLILNDGSNGLAGYGQDFQWGTVKITANSSLSGNPKPYMHYGDNPLRPRLHFWFGPLSMIDFLGNYNMWYQVSPSCSRFCWWPGTCHESPMYECKLGIQAALTDIQNNHPNDLVSLIMFSDPQVSSSDNDGSRFNRVRVELSRNYQNMQDSLWYPPNTVGNSAATVTPYDSNNLEVPRAMGGTCYSMGLMLAFNQFSGNSALTTYNASKNVGDAGGNGRKGAQKIVILETDGAPNTTATAALQNSGAYQSYYKVRYNSATPSSSDFPTNVNGYNDNDPTVTSQVYGLVQQLAAQDTASPPGFSTTTKPLQLHCIGFGPQFDPSTSTAAANTATLNQMQIYGNVTDGMPGYKIINGSQASIVSDLQQAFKLILQNGVQVSLIK